IEEIQSIYPNIEKKEFIYQNEVIDFNDLSIIINSKCDTYWHVNFGLVQFCFVVENGRMIKVNSVRIGYLGNEFPICC
ncbi:hypothetical protein D0X99_20150, partial [Algoriphagus lacus]